MRRKDREITNRREIGDVLLKCRVLRLAINADSYPYIVPMSYGVDTEGEKRVLWLHCAGEGRKLDLLKRDPRVGFEADMEGELLPGERGHRHPRPSGSPPRHRRCAGRSFGQSRRRY